MMQKGTPRPIPVMTPDLTLRLDGVRGRLALAGMAAVQALPSNPYDVQIAPFGPVTAYRVGAAPPDGWWNRVVGPAGDTTDSELDGLLAFYRDPGLQGYLDLNPLTWTADLARRLAARGLYAVPNGTILYGLPHAMDLAPPAGVAIRELGLEGADLFADLWAAGFELGADANGDLLKHIRRGAFVVPGLHRYVVYEGDTPAAMAALYIHDGIGYLNVGATLPAFRRRGYHTLLTRHRSAMAAQAGCTLLMGYTAGFGTASQNNMERAGLQIAFNVTTWVDGAAR
jgi:hypothetical protein